MTTSSEYTDAQLAREARQLVRGRGRFEGFTLIVRANSTSLRAHYVACKPKGAPAIDRRQYVSIAL